MVVTPDGVWHKDSHYWRKFVGGVHKLIVVIREKLEECLRNFFGEDTGGGQGPRGPLIFFLFVVCGFLKLFAGL